MSKCEDYKQYIENFDSMATLSSMFNGNETEKVFLGKILDVAIKSVPEAQCGSIWMIDGTLYKAIVGNGYDQNILEQTVQTIEEAPIFKFKNTNEILEIKNISNMKKYDYYIKYNKNKMVTLIAPLKVQKKIVGHIYIDNFKIENFSDISKKSFKIFSNFASTFLNLKHLRDSEKETNELNKVYLSFITHELRTPLTSILGYSETILRDKEMKMLEAKTFTRKIYTSSKHMNSLILDISTFNKLNRQSSLNIEKGLFKQILFDSISIVEPIISPDVSLNINYSGEIPKYIETDLTKLRQIFVNIIGNAIKYTDEGFVDINVSFEDKTKMFTVLVKDSGPGISLDKKEEIFKPFVRLAKDKPGSGLGLAIVKKTITILKGKIEFDSKINVGTTFVIKIPLSIKKI